MIIPILQYKTKIGLHNMLDGNNKLLGNEYDSEQLLCHGVVQH